ncbi:hypothetical protein CDD83_4150 [Cordyceps sp. RAO-2017]|nr:hypothetical protein CDD83_4150 [Cordyceps sp. RAO-2017]
MRGRAGASSDPLSDLSSAGADSSTSCPALRSAVLSVRSHPAFLDRAHRRARLLPATVHVRGPAGKQMSEKSQQTSERRKKARTGARAATVRLLDGGSADVLEHDALGAVSPRLADLVAVPPADEDFEEVGEARGVPWQRYRHWAYAFAVVEFASRPASCRRRWGTQGV